MNRRFLRQQAKEKAEKNKKIINELQEAIDNVFSNCNKQLSCKNEDGQYVIVASPTKIMLRAKNGDLFRVNIVAEPVDMENSYYDQYRKHIEQNN